MNIGIQTIVFGREIPELQRALDLIANLGYRGVEFAQTPEMLGSAVGINDLLGLLEERDLTLLGFSGGSLHERVVYCNDYRPCYLYVEDWEPEAEQVSDSGFTLALHPHSFKRTDRFEDAFRALEQHPQLKLLPDIAHLTIAGDDPIAVIHATVRRLAAVHFQDWTPEFGRSSHRYAHGFVEPSNGTVDLDGVLNCLISLGYAGWLVGEAVW